MGSARIRGRVGLEPKDGGSGALFGQDIDYGVGEWKRAVALVSDQPFFHESWTGQKNLDFIASFFPKWSPSRATELATRFRCPLEKKVKTLSKSFHLEETRLTQPDRLVLFMGLVAWTLLWCLLIGLQTHTRKAIQIKNMADEPSAYFDSAWIGYGR